MAGAEAMLLSTVLLYVLKDVRVNYMLKQFATNVCYRETGR